MTNSIEKLHELGQSLWYDNINRGLLEGGQLGELIHRGEIRGVTSNPTIFDKAISQSNDYDAQLIPLAEKGYSTDEIYEALVGKDVRTAADLLAPLYIETDGEDGYVSLEVDPDLAHDTDATVAEALRLWEIVDRPNLMVKIPATPEGIPAVRETIAAGVNVNITLIFSRDRYKEVMDAYLSGLEKRLADGERIHKVASVGSFFVSRIDTKADGMLDEIIKKEGDSAVLAASLKGKLAVANAKLAYQEFKEVFISERFAQLKERGARVQRPLWASTSTKNPSYSDVKYVESLIGPMTINTVPPHTLEAFRDHGEVREALENGLEEAGQTFEGFQALGLSFQSVTQELEKEGVESFARSFHSLFKTIEKRKSEI